MKYCISHGVGICTQKALTFINSNVYNTSVAFCANTLYETLHNNKKMSKGVHGIVTVRKDKQLE